MPNNENLYGVLQPYSPEESDVRGRMKALGMLTEYTPRPIPQPLENYGAPAKEAPQQDLSALSWTAHKQKNNYDHTDYEDKKRIWDDYHKNQIQEIAKTMGISPQFISKDFDTKYASDKPVAPKQGFTGFFGDTLSTAINSAMLGVKSISDLAAPGNSFSNGIQDVVDESEANQSALVQDDRKRVAREISEDEASGGSGIAPALKGMIKSPFQSAGKVIGGLAPAVAASVLSGGTAAPIVLPAFIGAQGAGQARGAIYDKLKSSSNDALMARSPAYTQLRNAGYSEADAKSELGSLMNNWAEIGGAGLLNAVTARIAPVERGLSGLTNNLRLPSVMALEGATNAAQGAGTQLATNSAIRNFLPDQSLTEGVAREGVTGLVAGGALGGAFGARRAPEHATDSPLPDTEVVDSAIAQTLALPAPEQRLGLPTPEAMSSQSSAQIPPSLPNFDSTSLDSSQFLPDSSQFPTAPRVDSASLAIGQYNATPEDVNAVVGTLPKIVKKEFIQNSLESALRHGALEELAVQQNHLGRAAQALIDRIESNTAELPMLADTEGAIARQSLNNELIAQQKRQEDIDLGLTGDVRNAQEARKKSTEEMLDQAIEQPVNANQSDVSQSTPRDIVSATRDFARSDGNDAGTAAAPNADPALGAAAQQAARFTADPNLTVVPPPDSRSEPTQQTIDNTPSQEGVSTSKADIAPTSTGRLTNAERKKRQLEIFSADAAFSRSAQKSVETNVRRGRASMNKSLLEKRDINRAMYRNDIGWIDFVWGDDKKGIKHIIQGRMKKDGLSEAQVTRLLTKDMVDTIAKGTTVKKSEIGKVSNLTIDYGDHQAVMIKRKGANGWLLTGWEKRDTSQDKKVDAGATGKGNDNTSPTRLEPTLARPKAGATSVASDSRPPAKASLTDTQRDTSKSGSPLGAENSNSITRPKQSIEDVRKAIKSDTFNHDVDVYKSLADAPEHIRKQAAKEGGADVEGFFDIKTNRVALIAENLPSAERAREVARHELIGHYGLENMVGADTMRELATKVATAERLGNKIFRELGKEIDRSQPGLNANRRASEIIAKMAERNMQNSIVRRVIDAVRQFLSKAGLIKSDITDAQVAKLLRNAQEYLSKKGRGAVSGDATVSKAAGSDEAKFSRTNTIPLASDENANIAERIKRMAANPNSVKNVAKTLLTEGGTAAQPKWLEDGVTAIFDYRNPLEQMVRRSGNTAAGKDFLNTMRTFEAASQKAIHDLETHRVDPMMKSMKKAWDKSFKNTDWYKEHGYRQFMQDLGTVGNLIKHGRERNAEILRKTDGKDRAGSGRTNAEIDALERDIKKEAPGLIEFYEGLYKNHLKPMLDYRDQTLRDAGLLTSDMESGRPKYDWYVPLFGDPNTNNEDGFSHGAGVNLKSPKDKQAMGRDGTLADSVLQNVLAATETSIRQAAMQEFKRSFVGFIKSNNAAKMLGSIKINEASHREIFERYVGSDGLVHERVKAAASMSPDALVLREGAQTTVLHIGNKKILEAMQGTNRGQIDGIFSFPARATRLLSAVYTRYNPAFPFMNKLRDSQSQLSFVMADAPVKNKFATARMTAANNAKFSTQWNVRPGSEYAKLMERYEKLGGSTMYSDLFKDDVIKNLENEFAKTTKATGWHATKAYAEKVGDFVDRVNQHMEMSSRIALFKALLDSGVNEREAALYTKNTMNFETRGKLGRQLGALYTFAGPALFDARRMAQSLRTPRGAAVMLAHTALMYSLYGVLKSMGGQDDDGIDRLNKVPLSQTGRYLTLIDDADGKGYKIPVGFGFGRIALTMAAAMHRYTDGVDDTATFVTNVAKDALLSNFSPVDPVDIDPSKDFAAWTMQQFTPSIMKPLMQLGMNQTGQGSPIHKPDEWTGSKLKFEQAWPSTSSIFKNAAKEIFDETGIDVYPETLQHLLRSYGGGGAMDGIRAMQLLGEKSGTETGLSDMPGLQTFSSRTFNRDMVQFRQNDEEIKNLSAQRDYEDSQGNLSEFDEKHPGIEQNLELYKQANKQIRALYKRRKQAADIESAQERRDATLEINRQIRAIQMRSNQSYKNLNSETN